MQCGVCSLRTKISDLDWDMESKRLVVAGDGSGIIVRCITWDTANNLGKIMVVMLMEMMMVLGDNGDEDHHDVVEYCQLSSSR